MEVEFIICGSSLGGFNAYKQMEEIPKFIKSLVFDSERSWGGGDVNVLLQPDFPAQNWSNAGVKTSNIDSTF